MTSSEAKRRRKRGVEPERGVGLRDDAGVDEEGTLNSDSVTTLSPGGAEDGTLGVEDDKEAHAVSKRDKQRAKLETNAISAMEAAKKKGVVYLSRVPPHMKPQKLRHILSEYGDLGRVYLAPEDPGVRKRRKKLKGNTGKNFSEGWVEFLDKKVAKRVATVLNGDPMGGKRRSAYHYDIWCLKYLPKFKWDYLTEEIAYQNAVREQKLAAEISAAKRERDFYLSRVDRAKANEARQKRRKKRAAENGSATDGPPQENAAAAEPSDARPRIIRSYSQKRSKPDPTDDADAPVLSQDVLALLAGRR